MSGSRELFKVQERAILHLRDLVTAGKVDTSDAVQVAFAAIDAIHEAGGEIVIAEDT